MSNQGREREEKEKRERERITPETDFFATVKKKKKNCK